MKNYKIRMLDDDYGMRSYSEIVSAITKYYNPQNYTVVDLKNILDLIQYSYCYSDSEKFEESIIGIIDMYNYEDSVK